MDVPVARSVRLFASEPLPLTRQSGRRGIASSGITFLQSGIQCEFFIQAVLTEFAGYRIPVGVGG